VVGAGVAEETEALMIEEEDDDMILGVWAAVVELLIIDPESDEKGNVRLGIITLVEVGLLVVMAD
jgi:hypothetical protein